MSHSLNIYRSTNDLTYNELPPPDYGDLDPFDNDAINKENALEFYRFELAILQVSGAQDQLQTHAATKENFAKGGQQIENQDDPVWFQIQNSVENEVIQVGSKIKDDDATDVSEQEAMNDPVTKVSRYADSMAKTGLISQYFQRSLLPSSTSELITVVARRTGLNTLIEWWVRRRFSPASARPNANNENLRPLVRADALYSLLAARKCGKQVHSALLQLSGWDISPERKDIFQTFLSCCEDGSWQRATCTFDSSMPKNSQVSPIDICFRIKRSRYMEACLPLSFNENRLWITEGGHRVLSEFEKSPNRVDLETLLTQGDLKTSNLDDSIRKFRFAHLLASSLCSLYSGPWIQQDWNSQSVHIIPNGEGRLVEMLDEAYVTCLVNTDWTQVYTSRVPYQKTSDAEACPRFFLSLAQLLVDIANGERSHLSSCQDDLYSWYKLLVDEVRRNRKDQLMGSYWDAIQGCLLYLENYDNQGQDSLEEEDDRLRARKVIHEHIVRHLQKNLNTWREQQDMQSFEDPESGQEISQPHGRAQTSVDLQHVGDSSSVTTLSRPQEYRRTTETKFTLWSDNDEKYTIIENPTTEPNKSSFIYHMNTFLDTYIEKLPHSTSNGDAYKRVRVAVIDTGLYVEEATLYEEGDRFLSHPDVKARVVDQRNFFSSNDTDPDPDDWEDEHGHGTHVARLVLKFAPRADVVVAKISNSKTLKKTKTAQLVNALKWAGGRNGGQADIINLSFSLGSMPEPEVVNVINGLISENKLIFVAASNTGGYGSRLWPASCFGVFAIHATNEFGTPDANMNPPPLPRMDNFATFGCDVESYWKYHYRSISGTSFATPVAAAICANILEFARRTQPETVASGLMRYSAMRALFRDHMTPNNVDGSYHCFRLWAKGLWDGDENRNGIRDVLWKVSR